mmetsp:Transcript_8082/g.25367  ORF Transcript_8082/g.25367 Transcript_8082/m.25367 type:complete len:483 (+) Transcript_8082:2-1450(+)
MVFRHVLLLALVALPAALGASASDFKSRVIYQLLTDRFFYSGAKGACQDLSTFCGGDWAGITAKLDYLQQLGVDALWISPVVENYPGGYHGYWTTDLYSLNSHFGSADDLRQLIQECHNRGFLVLFDVVANHMGGTINDIGSFNPFNESQHYHDCSKCPSSCAIEDYSNDQQVRLCRLAGLPDLNQTNPFVGTTLVKWIGDLVQEYGADGVRIDTVPEVNTDFWTQFQKSAGVFGIGEVFNGDPSYVAKFQGPLDATLSYPLFFTMRNVFGSQQSMYQLQSMLQQYQQAFSDPSVLGTFLDNHDNARFLHNQGDHTLYMNALLFTLFTQGIPVVYYGSEAGFSGGNDPANRESLWSAGFDTSGDLFKFIAKAIALRKQQRVWEEGQVQRYADDNFYAFTRGQLFVATTNVGSHGSDVSRPITYHPYAEGTKLCELLRDPSDCVTVSGGKFQVTLTQGLPKLYAPQSGEVAAADVVGGSVATA